MNKKQVLYKGVLWAVLSVLSFSLFASDGISVDQELLQKRVADCFNKVKNNQTIDSCKTSVALGIDKQIGLYNSRVHFHLAGGFLEKTLRRKYGICDNNFFVTAWIQELLVESHNFGLIDSIDDQLNASMKGLVGYYDKNYPNCSMVNFWQQKSFNVDKQVYYVSPDHLVKIARVFEKIEDVIILIARFFGADDYVNHFLESINMVGFFDQVERIMKALHIPPDTDDSALNLSLGCYLKDYAKTGSKNAFETWNSQNDLQSIERLLQKCVKYAYRPFSEPSDSTCTEIDPRTYYFLHEYLDQKAGQDEIALLTTWLTMRQETVDKAPYVHMPFNVNNVDVSVCANFVNALGNYAITFPGDMEILLERVSGLDKLIFDTSEYLEWAIRHNKILERPDIGALYYPSVLNTYWFVARTISLLSNAHNMSEMMPNSQALFSKVLENWDKAMCEHGTKSIQEQARTIVTMDGAMKHFCCWDDFLGEHDKQVCSLTKNDDRVYTSAIALNTLIDVCAERVYDNSSGSYILQWKTGMCDSIRDCVDKGIAGLLYTSNRKKGFLSFGYEKENAFFSGSVKENTLPFYYPFTVMEPLVTDSTSSKGEVYKGKVVAVDGYISPERYKHLIDRFEPPDKFTKYKNSGPFPFWSSPALTHALVLNVLSKYHQLTFEEKS